MTVYVLPATNFVVTGCHTMLFTVYAVVAAEVPVVSGRSPAAGSVIFVTFAVVIIVVSTGAVPDSLS